MQWSRKNSVSTFEDVNKAIAYLRRARIRSAKDVFMKPACSEEELGKLERLLAPLKEEDAPTVFSSWMELHLTTGGRVRLLGTLRRFCQQRIYIGVLNIISHFFYPWLKVCLYGIERLTQ